VGAGTSRPRRARQRLPSRLPVDPRQGELPAGDTAAPADPYRRSPGGAQALGSAPASAGLEHAGRAPGALARRVLPGRPARRRRAGHQVCLLQSRVRHAGPDRRRRQRAPARPLPARADVRPPSA
jgi:hypothetical protein